MLATVELNDQPCLNAEEISNESANRCLAAEFGTAELAIAERLPKNTLGIG